RRPSARSPGPRRRPRHRGGARPARRCARGCGPRLPPPPRVPPPPARSRPPAGRRPRRSGARWGYDSPCECSCGPPLAAARLQAANGRSQPSLRR
ncbi:MAG: hypothetical protein F4Z33_09495, partial [Gemmatimonadales bacterium]|nr:hypothetical protein [Gemmatimonadales bacterium]